MVIEAKWSESYPAIGQSRRQNGTVSWRSDYPQDIRWVIYATNAIESLNMGLRDVVKNRGSFPSDEALISLFYLAQPDITRNGWRQ